MCRRITEAANLAAYAGFRIARMGSSAYPPDRVKTQTPGRLFMNFSRFSAFSAITGPAERKNSLQMRRFQTISEFSHGLGRHRLFARSPANGSCRYPNHRASTVWHAARMPDEHSLTSRQADWL